MTVWQGECLKCNSCFEHPSTADEKPLYTFCPVCIERQYFLKGVVSWNAVVKEIDYPAELAKLQEENRQLREQLSL